MLRRCERLRYVSFIKYMNTTSLALSKQLKEAGFPQESYFWWVGDEDNHVQFNIANYDASETMDSFAAPTAEEILEHFPVYAKIPTAFKLDSWETWELRIHNGNNKWYVGYVCDGKGSNHVPVIEERSADTLAEAAGKMWLFLKENGLLPEAKQEK